MGGGTGGGGGRRGGRRRGRGRGRSTSEQGPAPWGGDPAQQGGGYPPPGTYATPEDWHTQPLPFGVEGDGDGGAAAPALQPQNPPAAQQQAFGAGIGPTPAFGPGPQQQQQQAPPPPPPPRPMEMMKQPGLLELMQDGFGFLRFAQNNYLPDQDDIYVPANLVRRYRIRPGSMVMGEILPARKPGQKPALGSVVAINDRDPEAHAQETPFKDLTPQDPEERFVLETFPDNDISMRVVDLLTPIGRGQRALIVAPPRTGKTILMQKMCNAIGKNYPDVKVIVLLVDERPEEVTDFRRNTKAEVVASCLDEGAANHVRVAEIVLEKMKRQVEAGHHIVVLLDSITRLGRAYNNEAKGGGRILSGGLDAKVLTKPKAFFGSARNIENGGSLTIISTALIDTGSRMDQVIFEEFKGTGNSEIVLSRQLANNRTFPSIDISLSGTRKDEKLFHPDENERIKVLRRVLSQLRPEEAMRLLIEKLEKTRTNAEFLLQFTIRDSA
jgi:transcription termination factor Rho